MDVGNFLVFKDLIINTENISFIEKTSTTIILHYKKPIDLLRTFNVIFFDTKKECNEKYNEICAKVTN